MAEDCLEFGEGHFDRIEIRTECRKIKKLRAPCLNALSDSRHLVRGEVVTDYHVPLLEFRREYLLDPRGVGNLDLSLQGWFFPMRFGAETFPLIEVELDINELTMLTTYSQDLDLSAQQVIS
jgi:hypothetical protein